MLRRIQNYPFLLWFGTASLLMACFVAFTNQPVSFDLFVLHYAASIRSPVLTNIFVSLTALGSWTLIALHTAIAFALLASTGDRAGAFQLAVASAGSITLIELAKGLIERARPTAVPALVEAYGSSYPSGHALAAAAMYVTIAILAFRHLPLFRQRVLLTIVTVIIVLAVGLSRVYLGVHYASDALSGILLGTAWAFILAGFVSLLEYRASQSSVNR